jgi:hypothetical protein
MEKEKAGPRKEYRRGKVTHENTSGARKEFNDRKRTPGLRQPDRGRSSPAGKELPGLRLPDRGKSSPKRIEPPGLRQPDTAETSEKGG